MKKPGIIASILGANLVFGAVCLALLGMGWLFFTTGEHFWWLIFCLAVGHFSYRANATVRAYQRWEREWNGMSGEGPRPIRLPRLGSLRIMLALAAWAFAAWFAITEGDDPNLRIPVLMFWAGSVLGSAVLVVGPFLAGKRGKGAVIVLLAKPLTSPKTSSTRRAIPTTVQRIMIS